MKINIDSRIYNRSNKGNKYTLILSGKITSEGRDGDADSLTTIGGLIVAKEITDTFCHKKVNCIYAISPEFIDYKTLLRIAIDTQLCQLDARYGHSYSDLTGYLWTDEKCKIGGHDIINILNQNTDKYAFLMISELPIDLGELEF